MPQPTMAKPRGRVICAHPKDLGAVPALYMQSHIMTPSRLALPKGPAVSASLDDLASPQLLIDLDILDANLARMQAGCRQRKVNLRVHFKSLKCGGLAKYLQQKGVTAFLAAKTNEAEVLADAGVTDILIANEIVGAAKLR